jgi:hypothetical protein
MSTNHRATPDEWEAVQLHADPNAYCHRDSCILELHYRVEALERLQVVPEMDTLRRAIREPMEQPTPPAQPAPATQRAQRLLDELEEGGLPAVLRHLAAVHLAAVWKVDSCLLLERLAAELEGRYPALHGRADGQATGQHS